MNLRAVKKLCIGIGDRNALPTGARGNVWIDDIGLCMPSCIPEIQKNEFDYNADCIVNFKDHAVEVEAFGGTLVDWQHYAGFADEWLEEKLWP